MERIYGITFLITSFWMKDLLIAMIVLWGKIRGKREKCKGRRRSRRGKNWNHDNSQSSLFSRLEKKKILLHACQENNDKKHDKSYCTLSTDFVHVVLKSLSWNSFLKYSSAMIHHIAPLLLSSLYNFEFFCLFS